MIIPAQEVRQSTVLNDELIAAIKRVMRDVERASHDGKTYCIFNPSCGWWLEDAVKREFEKAGYTFRPVGVVGGVKQLCEYITW